MKLLQLLRTISVEIVESCLILTALVSVFTVIWLRTQRALKICLGHFKVQKNELMKLLQLLRTTCVEIVELCWITTALVSVFHCHLAVERESPQDLPGATQSSKK